ncbi:polysaccharide pyruvyl transferase family protein [Sneathiella sp. CAU 1612]|uniref:Polysaccharide pyruvyl transferase family protein n=1 Tax=Sneathiella sedimenti TaxID=2816034 RepID=A0ABS3F2D1_9PROT|nr:polysaccharide pyruvyl transferase family protein [Sneathiella sedimenti]MBO0332673.1 polysaccharide pyruvyl transferase family protein [Sneathiella sedimenti]
MSDNNRSKINIGLFGAAPDTSNMGVSALFASTVEGITERLPNARFSVFDNELGKRSKTHQFSDGNYFDVEHIGIRAGHRYYLPENIVTVSVASRLGAFGAMMNSVVRDIDGFDVVLDISGGDSFSDIYGVKRFMSVVRPKLISLKRNVPLILLPQTYGPYFDSKLNRIAIEAVKGADMAWARDPHSFVILKDMLGDDYDATRHRSGVDFAFALGIRSAVDLIDDALRQAVLEKKPEKPVVGLNVSGLIYNDPNAAVSQYGFKADYNDIIHAFCDWLLAETDANLVLIPHVMSDRQYTESDFAACEKVAMRVEEKHKDRVFVSPDTLDQNQVKWLISKMDWFCGTRMHSTIAALSRGVPTSAIAYSDKTKGVFETCGQGDEVFDPRTLDTQAVIEGLKDSYLRRGDLLASLEKSLPEVKQRVDDQLSIISNCILDIVANKNN